MKLFKLTEFLRLDGKRYIHEVIISSGIEV